MAKRKKKTVTWWKKKVWREAFSPFIRLRDALKTTGQPNNVLCITCSRPYPSFGVGCAQAGHFIPGRRNQFLFDEQQVNAQCYSCNIGLKGNWPEYLSVMVGRHGQEAVDKMLFDAKNVIRKFTVEELEGLFEHYTAEIERLRAQPKPVLIGYVRRKLKD